MKETYGQFEIEYDENSERFIGTLGGVRIASSEKLLSLRKALDKHGEGEKAFKRTKVFMKEPWEGWIFGEVTSIADDGTPWCSWTKKNGKKERGKPWATRTLYLDIPENAEIRGRVDVLDKQIKAATKDREDLTDTMAVFGVEKP